MGIWMRLYLYPDGMIVLIFDALIVSDISVRVLVSNESHKHAQRGAPTASAR